MSIKMNKNDLVCFGFTEEEINNIYIDLEKRWNEIKKRTNDPDLFNELEKIYNELKTYEQKNN